MPRGRLNSAWLGQMLDDESRKWRGRAALKIVLGRPWPGTQRCEDLIEFDLAAENHVGHGRDWFGAIQRIS